MITKIYLLNLQLFAVINATTSATTGNDLSVENKTFYDMTLIEEAQAELIHDQFGQKTTMRTFRENAAWNGMTWPANVSGDLTTWTYDAASEHIQCCR